MSPVWRTISHLDLPWVRLLRPPRGHRMPQAFLALAVAVLCFIGVATAMVHATYSGGQERTFTRATTLVEYAAEGAEAIALHAEAYDLLDRRFITVNYFVPLNADTPPPPGLDAWPDAGEVALSPALERPEYASTVRERFGEPVATIGSESLASPTERLIYVIVPAEIADPDRMEPIADFQGLAAAGEIEDHQPKSYFYAAMLPLLMVGAVPLLVVAARLNDGQGAQTRLTLTLLGASRRELLVLVLARLRGPVVMGVGLAVLAVIPLFLVDLPVPGTEFVLAARDARDHAPVLVLGLAGFALLALAVATFATARLPVSRRRQGARFSRLRSNPVAALVFLLVAASIAPVNTYFADRQMAEAGTVAYISGVTLALLTLPSFIDLLVRWTGRLLARLSAHRGSVAGLLAGRQLFADPRAAARVAGSTVLCLLVLTQVQLWSGLLSLGGAPDQARIDERLVTTSQYKIVEEWRNVVDVLGDLDVAWIGIADRIGEERSLRLTADPVTLAAAGLPAGTHDWADLDPVPAVADYGEWNAWSGYDGLLVATEPGDMPVRLLMFSLDDTPLPVDDIQMAVRGVLAPPPGIAAVGEAAVGVAHISAGHAAWVALFGTVGAALLVAAMLLSAAMEHGRSRAEIGPLAAVAAPEQIVRLSARLRLIVPVVLGLGVGVALAYGASFPFTHPSLGLDMPWSFVLALTAAAALAVAAIARLVSESTIDAVHQWLPSTPDLADHL